MNYLNDKFIEMVCDFKPSIKELKRRLSKDRIFDDTDISGEFFLTFTRELIQNIFIYLKSNFDSEQEIKNSEELLNIRDNLMNDSLDISVKLKEIFKEEKDIDVITFEDSNKSIFYSYYIKKDDEESRREVIESFRDNNNDKINEFLQGEFGISEYDIADYLLDELVEISKYNHIFERERREDGLTFWELRVIEFVSRNPELIKDIKNKK